MPLVFWILRYEPGYGLSPKEKSGPSADLINLFCFRRKQDGLVGEFEGGALGNHIKGLRRRRFFVVGKIADSAVGIEDDGGFEALDGIKIDRLIQAMGF